MRPMFSPIPHASPSKVIRFSLIYLTLSSTGCRARHKGDSETTKKRAPQNQQAPNLARQPVLKPKQNSYSEAVWLRKSRIMSKRLGSRLQAQLTDALVSGDAVTAVQTCSNVAPIIANELSRAGELKVNRVTDKPRNAKNEVNAEDRAALAKFQKTNQADPTAKLELIEQTGTGKVRYLKGIRIKPLCLTCHGTKIAEPVALAIKKHYPGDRATGYRLGDLRGAFRVEWTLLAPKGLDAINVRAPRIGMVTGGVPSGADIPKLAKLGFSWVIDLRSKAETNGHEQKAIESSGMRYVNLPIRGSQDVTFESAKQLRRVLKQAGSSRVFLHCASGNRVGALLALLAFEDGATVENALEQGHAAGMTILSKRVEALLKSQHVPSERAGRMK